MKDNINDLVEDLYDLTRQFGVTWNTFNLVKYLVNNNVILNKRLTPDDLETGMWVWNESQGEYQRVRYILTRYLKGYHWCDGWGNVIEDDELWKYKKNSVENE